MRLLWMKSDYVIPPDSGGKLRSYNLLRELHRNCEITYLSFKHSQTLNDEPEMHDCAAHVVSVYKKEEKKAGPGFYARVMRNLMSPLPYVLRKYRSSKIVEHQRRFAQSTSNGQPTVILCDFLEMAENVDWSLPYPKVLFQHNVESVIWQRYFETETNWLKRAYFNHERKRMRDYERAVCNRFDLIFAVSEQDKAILQQEFGITRPVEVLETGVDTDFYSPGAQADTVPRKLVFLGSLDWLPNIDGVLWFAKEIYPLIKQRFPTVTFDIVGRRPSPKVLRLATKDDSIRVLADVADVRPHVAAGELCVVPLRIGGGSRIKIYEAMAMRRPVVSTSVGAEGLPLRPDEHIVIGDAPAEFAAQVVRLLENDRLRQSIAKAGFDLVKEHGSWKMVAEKLRTHCLELVKS